MVRFKVIRASKLLLIAAIMVLAAVVIALAARWLLSGNGGAVGASATLVEANIPDAPGAAATPESEIEAKTAPVFASSPARAEELPLDPGQAAIEIEIVSGPSAAPSDAPRPSVLIYHTHTHEAYEQVQDDPYEALEAWRTTDADHSVVRVGEELARQLEALGFDVTHDVTDHEGSELSTAYTRSLRTLESYVQRFDLYIDLHRDAYVKGAPLVHTAADGERIAQLMLLIGNGNGFDVKPHYAQNLAFAQALSQRINAREDGLCKGVLVKDGRYNQNIGVFAILVEVGHNRNTLAEALSAVPVLARSLSSLMIDDPDPRLEAMQREYIEKREERR